jgi:hypothetical protein
MNFKEAQGWVKEKMVGVVDDDYPDALDDLVVELMIHHSFTEAEGDAVVQSEWWV